MAGFGPDTIEFLSNLQANNNRDWFQDNRERYEASFLAPAFEFITEVGPGLQEIAPGVVAEPKVNGSLFRINRDTRFSTDKTPYKDHLDMWFWEGERRGAVSGFFLRIAPASVIVGVGAHRFDKDQLAAYRQAVVGSPGDRLVAIERSLRKDGFVLLGEELKQLPRGFEPTDEDRARLLRHKSLHTSTEVEHPKVLASARFQQWCLTRWRKMAPVHEWIITNVR